MPSCIARPPDARRPAGHYSTSAKSANAAVWRTIQGLPLWIGADTKNQRFIVPGEQPCLYYPSFHQLRKPLLACSAPWVLATACVLSRAV